MEPPKSETTPRTGFFDLPPEIRNQIYELVLPKIKLVLPKCVEVQGTRNIWKVTSGWPHVQSAVRLMRSTRTLYAEIAPVLYGAYTFIFPAPRDALRWTHQIGASVVHIRNVVIQSLQLSKESAADTISWLGLMVGARRLHRLAVPYRNGSYSYPKFPSARKAKFLSRLFLPLCYNIVHRHRAEGSHVETAELLDFLECWHRWPHRVEKAKLEVEARMRSRLESMLRTAEESIELEAEILHDMRHLFISPDSNDATEEQS